MIERPTLEEYLHDLVRLMPDDDRVAIAQGAARDLAAARRLWVVSLAHCGLDGTAARAA